MVGLLVDRRGFPLEIGCFEGNKAETLTILPIVKQFQDRHNITDMAVVADAGMLSVGNLKELDEAGMRFIVGSRATKAPSDLESHFRWHGDAFTTGRSSTPSPHATNAARPPAPVTRWCRPNPSGTPSYINGPGVRCGILHEAVGARQQDLTLQENKARAVVDGEKTAKTPRFVKTTNGATSLDEASLARARRLVGLKGYVTNHPRSYVTNIPVTAMDAREAEGPIVGFARRQGSEPTALVSRGPLAAYYP